MNSVSETVLNGSGEHVETARQQQTAELKTELVELGKVSQTSGGWFGAKADTGLGFETY